MKPFPIASAALIAVSAFTSAHAEERITYRSAAAGSSYYQMGVEIAEAVRKATDGGMIVTIEEGQGSVQNVMEVRARGADYVFTAPPALIGAAKKAAGPFEGKGNPAFDEIRALFPIPSLTMHFVMAGTSGATNIMDVSGKTILIGSGTFGASEAQKYLDLFGLTESVTLADAELNNAVAALKNGQIEGFVTAGSFPAPNVVEAAASMDVTLLSLTDDQVAQTKRTRLVIPAGTYAGQKEDVVTTSLPVAAYATTKMSDEAAYELTKTFWEQREAMAKTAPWWGGVNAGLMSSINVTFHPGAIRYYEEAGMALTEEQK